MTAMPRSAVAKSKGQSRLRIRLVLAVLATLSFLISAAPVAAAVDATATISTTQTSAPYSYHMTLHNTGTLNIDTLWFAWLDYPEQNFMPTAPLTVSRPAGWFGSVTNDGLGDGYGIQFYSNGAGLAPNQSLSGFDFTSNTTPAQLESLVSTLYGDYPVSTAFAYNGGEFSPDGISFTVQVVPEPSTFALAALGIAAAGMLWRRRSAAV